ncbi:cob(I)alamin adenosyltransferase [Enterococcus sp. PF1-24]|uniref:cob(I)yrinic acid a,c-diamide adenosyltransferase n=1 Tax=unclassified Enterococcus TaxID=2608891 RepID=UPI002475CAF6|nr:MULTISPECIES: cob(I)yrinic acid a,c-diamide adenosyltransferase [unclassified Enterococcus]MDH6363375.1 cob(I)alamin adenosyltransferase [Enterococcus sp. PFB1-1]MDH6400324.1 cob(I)alamin adenosyltransferase [Enterococcus sp. PF1-24]
MKIKMKIYTGYGDTGYTRMVGGTRERKNHPRVETYGSIDTLNSQVGFAVSLLAKEDSLRTELLQVQQWIFQCSSDFATPDEKRPYRLETQATPWLEKKVDEYWQQLPSLDKFILPGGTQIASALHLCRCFTREVERKAVTLIENGGTYNPETLIFLNRLSDYFFALARWVNCQANETEIVYENSSKVFSKKEK